MVEAEITDLFVMILNGILIRKICGFANTDHSYIIVKGEKHFSLESKLTRGAVIGPRQASCTFILASLECFILLLCDFCSVNP